MLMASLAAASLVPIVPHLQGNPSGLYPAHPLPLPPPLVTDLPPLLDL